MSGLRVSSLNAGYDRKTMRIKNNFLKNSKDYTPSLLVALGVLIMVHLPIITKDGT